MVLKAGVPPRTRVRRCKRSITVLCHLVDLLNEHSDFLVELANVLAGVVAGTGVRAADHQRAGTADLCHREQRIRSQTLQASARGSRALSG